MHPPLPNGTLLQNRFRIVNILGQGGCGRTYLATDEQRFEERCAIKEYFPSPSNSGSALKSQQLFHREAELLYQLQHPQIPQFRASFAETDRFFFAQDFVAGKPYADLWQDRSASGETFSESEVVELLERLLPVLTYIHARKIFHRDISLDNIMLRESDCLPVLIDFGVGTQTLTEPTNANFPFGTMVGKAGYAPIEQLKTGKVYANSDLYALAVCAIVLLTGKAPADLFDEMTVNWVWRTHAPRTTQRLATILDRMLNYRPDNRYQSADEVLAQLATITNPQLEMAAAVAKRSRTGQYSQAPTATIDRDRSPSPVPALHPNTPKLKPQPIRTSSTPTSQPRSLPKSWYLAIGIGAIGIMGAIGLARSQSWRSTDPIPAAAVANSPAHPKATASSDSIASRPTPATPTPQLISPQGTAPVEIAGAVAANGVRRYQIEGSPDRELQIQVKSGSVRVGILHPDGRTPPGAPSIASKGNYFFPFSGIYSLEIVPKSPTATNFTISIALVPTTPGYRPPLPPDRTPPPFN